MRVALAVVALVASVTVATAASAAFTVPPLVDGHVVDTSGKLSPDDVAALNRQMEATRLQSGYVIDALVVGSLEGGSIDDVAYQTFQTWKPGDAQRDNGVLIVVAPSERQDRIEVGKGVEGSLTDLQTDDIRRQFIEPRLKEGDLRGGIGAGADAIAKVLVGADPGQGAQPQGTRIGARTHPVRRVLPVSSSSSPSRAPDVAAEALEAAGAEAGGSVDSGAAAGASEAGAVDSAGVAEAEASEAEAGRRAEAGRAARTDSMVESPPCGRRSDGRHGSRAR